MAISKIWTRMALVAASAVLLNVLPVVAADYPSRPVTLVVAFTPGGPSDVLARIVGKKMEQLLGQPFVIENRPGAGGNIAAEGRRACGARRLHAADGQQQHPRHQCERSTRQIDYDAGKDFVPITLIGSQANILVVNPGRAGAIAEGTDRAREGPARQAQFCFVGLRRGRASRRRTVQGGSQDRHRARAVQGRRAGLAGCHRRARCR